MRKLLIAFIAVGAVVGCSQNSDGDVEAAKKAAAEAPKTEAQLPPNMPPEAKRAAMGAMGAQQAMANQAQQSNQARMQAGK